VVGNLREKINGGGKGRIGKDHGGRKGSGETKEQGVGEGVRIGGRVTSFRDYL
jgi:hypothetical protein